MGRIIHILLVVGFITVCQAVLLPVKAQSDDFRHIFVENQQSIVVASHEDISDKFQWSLQLQREDAFHEEVLHVRLYLRLHELEFLQYVEDEMWLVFANGKKVESPTEWLEEADSTFLSYDKILHFTFQEKDFDLLQTSALSKLIFKTDYGKFKLIVDDQLVLVKSFFLLQYLNENFIEVPEQAIVQK